MEKTTRHLIKDEGLQDPALHTGLTGLHGSSIPGSYCWGLDSQPPEEDHRSGSSELASVERETTRRDAFEGSTLSPS